MDVTLNLDSNVLSMFEALAEFDAEVERLEREKKELDERYESGAIWMTKTTATCTLPQVLKGATPWNTF